MPQLLLSLTHHCECTGDRLWDGVVQFGTFNRLRMCPMLEVRSFFFSGQQGESIRKCLVNLQNVDFKSDCNHFRAIHVSRPFSMPNSILAPGGKHVSIHPEDG